MSYKHGRSAKYPDVSKPHFWNSGRGPYPTGAAHVSLTAVVEAHQTCGVEATPTAGSPRSVKRRRSHPKDVPILRGNDLLDGARTDEPNDPRGSSTAGQPGKYGAEAPHCLHGTNSQASQNPRLSGGAPVTETVEIDAALANAPAASDPAQTAVESFAGRNTDNQLRHSPEARSRAGNVPGERSGGALIRLQRGQECR